MSTHHSIHSIKTTTQNLTETENGPKTEKQTINKCSISVGALLEDLRETRSNLE